MKLTLHYKGQSILVHFDDDGRQTNALVKYGDKVHHFFTATSAKQFIDLNEEAA